MSLLDHYEPDPPLACPACGAELEGWQGKEGDCAMLVWRQGHAAPVDQEVPDEIKGYPEVIEALRLPEEFEIYTQCCGEGFFITAYCTATQGVWSHTELETAESARHLSSETRGHFKRRLAWLRGPEAPREPGSSGTP